jgi:hypothetical protein
VLVKVFLVAAIRGIGSMRETLRIAQVDLSIRRFLGYGLTEALPHHATFSYAQCVRFAHSSVFEQLFTQVLASCREAGLLDGSRLIVDATHVEADAALKSLRAELQVIDGDGSGDRDGLGERPALALAAPRSGPTAKRKASNATAVSRTDPEAKLRYKPGHRPHLVYRAQVATDPKARVIVAVLAEPATGHEADSLPIIIDRSKWLRHKVAEIVADAGYASDAVYTDLATRRIEAFIPPQPNMLKRTGGQAARKRCRSLRGRDAAITASPTAKARSQNSNATAPTAPAAAAPPSCRSNCCSQRPRSTSNASLHTSRPPKTPAPATTPPPARTSRSSRSSTPAYTPSPPTRARLLRQAPRRPAVPLRSKEPRS